MAKLTMTSADSLSSGVDLIARLDEHVLVERVRADDPLAFEAIFRCYHAELCAIAERIVGSRAGAEDVVQDVFLRLWKLRQRWHVTISVQAYLRRAVRNVALRHASRSSVRGHMSLQANAESAPGGPTNVPILVDSAASPATHAEVLILADELAQAASRLPSRAREVFSLSRDHGLSTKEIAHRLGIAPKTVEIYMTRALTVLRAVAARWRER